MMTPRSPSRVRHGDSDVTLTPSLSVTAKSQRQRRDACASLRRHTRDRETYRRQTSRVRHGDADVTPLAIKIALPFQRGRKGVDLAGYGQARPSAAPHTPGTLFFGEVALTAFFWQPQKLRGGSKAALGTLGISPIFCRSQRQRDRHLLRPFDVALTEAGPYAHA